MSTLLMIRRSTCLASPQEVMADILRLACAVVCIAIPIGVLAQTNDREIDIDAAIRSLPGPGSHAQWKQQPDGSWLGPSFSKAGPAGDASAVDDDSGQLAAQCYQRRDFTNAAQHATEAAKHGDAVGATVLGLLALEGKGGVPHDEARAITLFQFAADQGYTRAMVELADCHLYGKGVPPDRKTAIRILNWAGNLGDLDSMRFLCRIHWDPLNEYGRHNYLAGYWWWRKAMRVELAAHNSFVYIQAAEVVVALVLLLVLFFATRYVKRVIVELRRPSFLQPGSPVVFNFVSGEEDYRRMVSEYRGAEASARHALPVPLLNNSAEGTLSDDQNLLDDLDPFLQRVSRWTGFAVLVVIGIGFTNSFCWSAHWKELLGFLTVVMVALGMVMLPRKKWLLKRIAQSGYRIAHIHGGIP